MHEWLEAARERIAARSAIDPSELLLTDPEIAALLDFARVAAHSSGDRTNAPLVCFLLGRAMGLGAHLDLAELARAASSSDET